MADDREKAAVKTLVELRRNQMRCAEEGAPREAAEAISRLGSEIEGILNRDEFKTTKHLRCDGVGCHRCGYLGYVRDTDEQ